MAVFENPPGGSLAELYATEELQCAVFPDRVGAVVHLYRIAMSADEVALIIALASYFEAGQGELPLIWRRAERLFLEVKRIPLGWERA